MGIIPAHQTQRSPALWPGSDVFRCGPLSRLSPIDREKKERRRRRERGDQRLAPPLLLSLLVLLREPNTDTPAGELRAS
jgi:hypothetical protein